MKVVAAFSSGLLFLSSIIYSCNDGGQGPSPVLIKEMNLKRGDVIACGADVQKFGTLRFELTGNTASKEPFALGLKLLHSFEYDEAEKVFAGIIDNDPRCAMAYWGVAMSNFHALWAPPTEAELKKGAKAVALAQSISQKAERESAYIDAIAAFYKDYETTSHRSRCLQFENAMEGLVSRYPGDTEAAIFYALALNAAADPTDKTMARQKKAGQILNQLYKEQPDHPGVVHYLIHTYDAPELAMMALPAARRYASVAPASAHALHMPSHIFTRLGFWDESVRSNLASVAAARCYADASGIKGHWDEELHGMDYLVYAYLQRGQNALAKQQLAYLDSIHEVDPANFKVAYAFAAMPARYALENKNWTEAATLRLAQKNFSWENFPWQKAIIHFARVVGAAHTGNPDSAAADLAELKRLHAVLQAQKDGYKAGQVEIQLLMAEAWIKWKEGRKDAALAKMYLAANLEDKTEKHPVTPGEVIPAREMLGELLLQVKQARGALQAFEASLKKHPNRFNGLYGAGLAAERSGNLEKATFYYRQLTQVADAARSNRKELQSAIRFLKEN